MFAIHQFRDFIYVVIWNYCAHISTVSSELLEPTSTLSVGLLSMLYDFSILAAFLGFTFLSPAPLGGADLAWLAARDVFFEPERTTWVNFIMIYES